MPRKLKVLNRRELNKKSRTGAWTKNLYGPFKNIKSKKFSKAKFEETIKIRNIFFSLHFSFLGLTNFWSKIQDWISHLTYFTN